MKKQEIQNEKNSCSQSATYYSLSKLVTCNRSSSSETQQVSSKLEKVPRSIQGEKSRKDTASSVKQVFNNKSLSMSPKGGRNQVSGRVSFPCWLATPVANAP